MTFAANIPKQSIPKYSLVIVRPRAFLEEWVLYAAGVYQTPFTFGRVTRVWPQAGSEMTEAASVAAISAGQYYHDRSAGILYIGASVAPDYRVAEYELNLSDQAFTGPCDPLDSSSEIVDWIPAIAKEPLPQNGSRDTQFGFSPLFTSTLEINNADGWLNEQLHGSSFNFAFVKAFVLANEDLEDGVDQADVKATLVGYCGNSLRMGPDGIVSLPVTDFFRLLDQPAAPLYRFVSSSFTGRVIDPQACALNSEWYVRRVRGMVDGHVPVNVDYNETASTSNNRIWITDEEELDPKDGTRLDESTYTYTVDTIATAAHGTTDRTYFTTTHKLNVGDFLTDPWGLSTPWIRVTAVDRANKWIEHVPMVGRVLTPGDTCTRYYVAQVLIVDSNGLRFELKPGRDFLRWYGRLNSCPNVKGFALANNFEANVGFTDNGGVFDPGQHQIVCRLYGPKELPTYSDDVTSVGTVVDDGGIDATAVSILYFLLLQAGIDADLVDEASFQAVGADSYPLGIAWPATAAGSLPTYKDLIIQVLQSMLWRLGFVSSGDDIKIGLIATEPMTSADQEADEEDHQLLEYTHDYADVYYRVKGEWAARELRIDGTQPSYALSDNTKARDLHLSTEELELTLLQYVEANAQAVTDRLAFMLGDRRALYTVLLEQRFLDRADLGTKYDLVRQQMPGFAFEYLTQRTRRMQVVEMQKSTQGVKLVLDDQAGIQDNQGSW